MFSLSSCCGVDSCSCVEGNGEDIETEEKEVIRSPSLRSRDVLTACGVCILLSVLTVDDVYVCCVDEGEGGKLGADDEDKRLSNSAIATATPSELGSFLVSIDSSLDQIGTTPSARLT